MRKLFGLLACLAFSFAIVGCENAEKKKIDKAASEEKKEVKENANAQDKAIDEQAKQEKAQVKDTKDAADADIDANAKVNKEAEDEEGDK